MVKPNGTGGGRRRWALEAPSLVDEDIMPFSPQSSRQRASRRRHLRTAAASIVAALVGTALLRGNLSGSVRQESESTSTQLLRNGHGPYLGRRRRRLESTEAKKKRLAVVRPFAPFSAAEIVDSFGSWDTYWPCYESDENDESEYDVDLILSYSQTYEAEAADSPAVEAMTSLQKKFDRNQGWNHCFASLHHIEAAIPPHMDLYERNHVQLNRHWVNGPNSQFRSIMEFIQRRNEEETSKGMEPYYEAVLILEGDSQVQKLGWLDRVLDEIKSKAPFAILGSRYKGHSWDSFRDQMPTALLEHINGNAVYNVTHPLTEHYVAELKEEELTYFNAIPYDYRISQMISEGRYRDYTPEFPFPEMRDESGKFSVTLPSNKKLFESWWAQWGGEGDANPIKESSVIHNWAATNYLPEHIDDNAPIVHGKGAWQAWDHRKHDITLVVTDWTEDFARSLLSTLDYTDHPFSSILVMREPNALPSSQKSMFDKLWEMFFPEISTKIPMRYVERHSPAFMDLCDAPVSSSWFMMTNSYHKVADDVALMFTHDSPPKPLIPFVPANSKHCTDYAACREVYSLAQEIHPSFETIVLDMDMVYHTSSRNAFCDAWKKTNGREGEILFNRIGFTKKSAFIQQSIPRGPTASAYLAYLQSSHMADSIYAFTNRLDHGAKDAFIKIHPDVERERHLALTGDSTTGYLYHTAFDEYVTQKEKSGSAGLAAELQSVRRMLQIDEQGGIAGQTAMEDLELEANIFDWFGRLFKRLFFDPDDQDEAEGADPTASAQEPKSLEDDQEQEQGASQRSRAGGTPLFSSRTKGGGGGGGNNCAAEGDLAKACGASGKAPKECCATTSDGSKGLICDPNGLGLCVENLGSYGGGEVARDLIMESPGWLVHNKEDFSSRAEADAAIETRKKKKKRRRRMRGRVGGLIESVTSFLGGMLGL